VAVCSDERGGPRDGEHCGSSRPPRQLCDPPITPGEAERARLISDTSAVIKITAGRASRSALTMAGATWLAAWERSQQPASSCGHAVYLRAAERKKKQAGGPLRGDRPDFGTRVCSSSCTRIAEFCQGLLRKPARQTRYGNVEETTIRVTGRRPV